MMIIILVRDDDGNKVKVEPVYCLLGIHKIDLKFHGSSIKKFYDVFVKIIESVIRKDMKEDVSILILWH